MILVLSALTVVNVNRIVVVKMAVPVTKKLVSVTVNLVGLEQCVRIVVHMVIGV